MVDVKEVELTTLWGRVIEEVASNAPQHRAFLQLTKPLGLLHNDDQTTLLVATPNLFAKYLNRGNGVEMQMPCHHELS